MNKNKYIVLAIGACVAGFAFTGWGIESQGETYSGFLLSLGGALVGAGLAQLIATYIGFDFLESLKKSVIPGLDSEEDKIQEYRKRFHHYHLTQIDGKAVWRYSVIDFSNSSGIGKLSSKTQYINKANKKTTYVIEGCARSYRLILCMDPEKREEPVIVEVYPFIGKGIQTEHCGIVILETWDEQTHYVGRCILSESVLSNWSTLGTINSEVAKSLDKKWESDIGHDYSVLTSGAKNS